jgi:hypothetical protein
MTHYIRRLGHLVGIFVTWYRGEVVSRRDLRWSRESNFKDPRINAEQHYGHGSSGI